MEVFYEELDLEELRLECTNREIEFGPKDGKRNLVSRLRVFDKATAHEESIYSDTQILEEDNGLMGSPNVKDSASVNALSFKEQIELLRVQREMRREEEERQVREEERLRQRRREEEEREMRQYEWRMRMKKEEEKTSTDRTDRRASKPMFLKIREMRENEDIEDYFRVFEMTAKAQFIPENEWLGSLIPRLSEKAKAIYLEIPDDKAQDFKTTKEIIFESYQHTVDYYRYKFRNSEKGLEEDFVQWNNRSRRYLDRWLRVAKAKGSEERIVEQILIEKMLDSVSPELRSWLIEKKPKSSGELATLANEHIQAKKGPLIDGKYVGYGKKIKAKATTEVLTAPQSNIVTTPVQERPSQVRYPPRRGNEVKCFVCGKSGHLSYDCKDKKRNQSGTGLLCMTPLESEQNSDLRQYYVTGYISGKSVNMLVDSGCTRTLINEKFAEGAKRTGEFISLLTASGERLTVPLAWVTINSKQGDHLELVGVLKSLPVDVLLGRSSFGQTLTRNVVMEQWERNTHSTDVNDSESKAFVLTRSQVILQKAQEKRDEKIDRESKVAVKSLAPEKPCNTENSVHNVSPELLMGVREDSKSQEQLHNKLCDDVNHKHVLDRNHDQLITDQKCDVTLKEIYDSARDQLSEESDGYYLQNGVLMHRKHTTNEHDGMNYINRIVVPESYRQEILRLGHAMPLAGHMGQEKTHSRISFNFYWPKLHFDVKKYCATCPECQLVSRRSVASRAPLRPVPIVNEPFKKIAIDIIGELPRSKTGCKYILTIVDYATRYPEAIPLKNISSKTVADALIQCFARLGIPGELVSDQGSNFLSKLMVQLYEQLGISKIQTSVYHPEANGLVERFNGTLKTMLRKFVSESVQDWDKYLPYLLFAYREVPCQSTGYSPFEMLYGRTPRGPMSIIKENWLDENLPQQNLVSDVLEVRRRMVSMQKNVEENLKVSQAKQKRLYDLKSTSRRFAVGDKVLVLLPTPGSKLETKWHGPFVITKVRDDGRSYEVDTNSRKKRHRTYYINLLKKWQDRDDVAALAVADILPHNGSLLRLHDVETWRDVHVNENLLTEQRSEATRTLETFSDVLSGTPSRTTAAIHNIDTGDAEPIRSTPYKVPQKLEVQVSEEINKMLDMGVVRPSKSPWASPVVIVPKPDQTIRFCVDYRRLNRVTKMDAYPIPRLDRIVERVAAASYITTLDLTKGYWQIPLADEAIEKSAFISAKGLFEFTVMPFGMKTAPATFQRMMNEVIIKDLGEFANAYIDDVAIDTKSSFKHHMECLRCVLQRLREFNLRARPTKCKIAMPTTDYMGHKVGSETIHPKDVLVRAIDTYPTPVTKKQVRSFLGLVGYYRKFIPNFSERALALTDLTKGSNPTKVNWSNECQASFQDLKQAMKGQPLLVPPNWENEFVLQVDASQRGIGAILSQKDGDGEHPIAYASRKLQPREEKLSTTEKECLAIVWGVEHFRYYLWGRAFTLQTDHNPLIWLDKVKDKNQKLLRWSVTLQEYCMNIEHKKGIKNTNVDALSRV